jgi:selenocysteine lyase/cysteine desulfurase
VTIFGDAECRRRRGDFPSLRRVIGGNPVAYLDGPGGTQVPSAVIDAIADCYRSRNVNTHGSFPVSEELDQRMIAARNAIADFLGAKAQSAFRSDRT